MRFNVSSSTLFTRLQTISRVMNSKNSMPILDCILFELQGGNLRLTASDSESWMVTNVEVPDHDGEGRFAIKAKTILDSLKEMSEMPLTIEINEEDYSVMIEYQNGVYNFVGANGNDFPPIRENDPYVASFRVRDDLLLEGLSRTLFATGVDEMRPIMNGVFFDKDPENLTLVASDGHKLVRNIIKNTPSEGSSSFVLPKKTVNLVKNTLTKGDGETLINFNQKNANLTMRDYTLTCRLVEGNYPNYRSVIPKDNPFIARVDRAAFTSATRRICVFSSESNGLVRLHFENNTMVESSQDIEFATNAEERLTCDYSGSPISIGFKGQFLLEVLNGIGSCDEVEIRLADPSRAGIIVPAEQSDDEDVLMLLMPMMIND